MNGAQQLRLNQSINALPDMLDKVDALASKWQGGKFPILNKANLALAKGGRTNIAGFALRLLARLPFLFIAGRLYGPDIVGRFALAVVVVEFAALVATLGLKRGLAQALTGTDRPHVDVAWDAMAVAFVHRYLAGG